MKSLATNRIGVHGRHGDVGLKRVAELPSGAVDITEKQIILAVGEVTGHAHRIKERTKVRLFKVGDQRYLVVERPQASLVHEEHGTLLVDSGVYQVIQQVEYVASAPPANVRD